MPTQDHNKIKDQLEQLQLQVMVNNQMDISNT